MSDHAASIENLKSKIRDVPDFPKPGIIFKDITPILGDGASFREAIGLFVSRLEGIKVDKILGVDARGFIFGAAVAHHLGVGFVPVRKKGKLPFNTVQVSYELEYGEATLELHTDAVLPGENVVLVDDLLATGGTARAAMELVQELGATLSLALFLVELEFLDGRKKLQPAEVVSFLKY